MFKDGKISFADGFALFGVALATFIVVLDKADKLKPGPILFVLLLVAFVMTVPLALGNAWVAQAKSTVTKSLIGLFFVCTSAGVFLGTAYWITPDGMWPKPPLPAALVVTMEVKPYIYAAGTEIAGVHFLPQWTDARVMVDNSSDRDFDSVDISIDSDMKIEGFGQVTSLEGVAFISDTYKEIPIVDRDGHTVSVRESSPNEDSIRVRIKDLPSHSQAQFVLALATINPDENGKSPANLYGPRGSPKWIRVTGSYRSSGEEHKVDNTLTVKTTATAQSPKESPVAHDTEQWHVASPRAIAEALANLPKGSVKFVAPEQQSGSPNYITCSNSKLSLSYDPVARTVSFITKSTGEGLILTFGPKERHFIAEDAR